MRPAAGCSRCFATPSATSASIPVPARVAVARTVLDPGVLRGRHRGQRRGGQVGVLVVATGVRAGLGRDHRGDLASGPHAAGVDVEVVEVVARVGLDPPLLRLQHHLVLEEDVRDALTEPRGDHLLVQAPVTGEGPEVEAGVVGLGGHRVDHGAGDALAAVALGRPGSRLGDAHVDRDRRRRGVADDLPPVDETVVVGEAVLQVAPPERRRLDAEHPLGHRHGVPGVGDLEVGLAQGVVPDGRPVHELLVGEVHEVVDDELVAAVDVDGLAVARPVGVVVVVQVGHRVRIGERRVAGPHPHVAVPLDHRVGVHRGARIDRVLRRHERGPAVGVVADAVVAAHDLVVAAQLAHRQRRQPVPARVGERDGPPCGRPVEHDRPPGDRLRQQVAADLVVPGRGVPGVERVVAERRVAGDGLAVATSHISSRRRRPAPPWS